MESKMENQKPQDVKITSIANVVSKDTERPWQIGGETIAVEPAKERADRYEAYLSTVELNGKQTVVKVLKGLSIIGNKEVSETIFPFETEKIAGVYDAHVYAWEKVNRQSGQAYISGYDIIPVNDDEADAIKDAMESAGFYLVNSNQYKNTDTVMHFNRISKRVQAEVARKTAVSTLSAQSVGNNTFI